nr:hypothetical protein [Tanacetum cinerariifolium]
MELAVQFDDASTAKDDLRKAYEKCNDIIHESRALIDTFFKQVSDKDYEINLAMYRKAHSLNDDKPDEYYYEMEAEEQKQWNLENKRETRLEAARKRREEHWKELEAI